MPCGSASTVWLTGLPGAGKTTLARALEQVLATRGQPCCVLDGDELRRGLSRDLGYSDADRSENIRRVAEVARLFNRTGVVAIVALISPLSADRARAREIIGAQAMIEVHVATPLAICEARDPKGHYKRARQGEIANFTGVGATYEAPQNPALSLDTSMLPVEVCVTHILSSLFT